MQLIELLCLPRQAVKMANEVLKQVFQDMQPRVVRGVNPDSVTDALFSKNVISCDDHRKLRDVPVSEDRCRELLSVLHVSSHPQAFIRLRLALLDEYPSIVDEIDKKLPSLTSQLQQLQLRRTYSIDGKLLSYETSHTRIQHTLKVEITQERLPPIGGLG